MYRTRYPLRLIEQNKPCSFIREARYLHGHGLIATSVCNDQHIPTFPRGRSTTPSCCSMARTVSGIEERCRSNNSWQNGPISDRLEKTQ